MILFSVLLLKGEPGGLGFPGIGFKGEPGEPGPKGLSVSLKKKIANETVNLTNHSSQEYNLSKTHSRE